MKKIVRSAAMLAICAGIFSASALASTSQPVSVPLTFEQNDGQAPAQYPYLLRHGGEILFSPEGVTFAVPGQVGHDNRLKLEFTGANPRVSIHGVDRLQAESNYILGKDASKYLRHVPNYGNVRYENLYPGIRLDFYGNGQQLEHDFTVAPGANPATIAFHFEGAMSMELGSGGDLVVRVDEGDLRLKKPYAYQTIGRVRRPVEVSFARNQDGRIGFHVGSYDRTQPLTIDPVFVFSTYLDGSQQDNVEAVTTDSAGNIYLTGFTSSSDFPIGSNGKKEPSCGANGSTGCPETFISKLNPTGTTLLYTTFLGGTEGANGGAIAVDAGGNVIVAGLSSSHDFPAAGAISSPNCQINANCYFLASIKPDGSTLNYSGLIGGEEGTYGSNNGGVLAVDTSGNAYLTGTTDSANFVVTSGTVGTAAPGYPYDSTFVLKVDPTGKLLYATVINGSAADNPLDVYTNWVLPTGITVDAAGKVTIAGTGGPGMPTTSGAVAADFPNATVNVANAAAGYVLQLNATASAINFATYVPGTDTLNGMAVDSTGNMYLGGVTSETDLPVSTNAYQKAIPPGANCTCNAGYVVKLNPTGTAVLAATYLTEPAPASNIAASMLGVALDSQSNVFLGGWAGASNFPMQNPLVSEYETGGSIADMVLAEMSSDLSTLKFGSFLNATSGVFAGSSFSALAVDASDNLIVAGTTDATNYPTTAGSFQPTPPASSSPYTSYVHSFVSKIDMGIAAPSVCVNTWSVNFNQVTALTTQSQTLTVTNCGNAPLNFSSVVSSVKTITTTQSCGAVAAGGTCAITLTFAPIDDSASSGTLTLTDNAAIPTQVISLNGQGVAPDLEPLSNPFAMGHAEAGGQTLQESLTLYNRGNANLNIKSMQVSGTGFSLIQNGCSSYAISPNFPCTVELSFAPAAPGNFTGTLTVSSNDPVHPQLSIALTGTGDATFSAPGISALSNITFQGPLQTLQINNGAANVTVNGTNFYPESVVDFNGTPTQTTFVSNSMLQATIPASQLTTLGEFPVTVVNPSPGGGVSAASTITTYSYLVADFSALVSVPATGLLYAAVPSSDTTNPNTVIPVSPTTGTLGTPIPVGNNPGYLAPSSDGSYLYVANVGDNTVQRINLKTNTVERTFAYAPNSSCSSCNVNPATDLQSVPGQPTEVVLAQGSQLALYNDSGLVNSVPNGFVAIDAPSFDSIAFAGNPLTIYAEPFTSVQNPFFTIAQLTSSGLSYTTITGNNYGVPTGTGGVVRSDGTLLYTNSGEVWNPSTQMLLGTAPVSANYYLVTGFQLDTNTQQIFVTGSAMFPTTSEAQYVDLSISSYSMQSFAAKQTLTFPGINASENFGLSQWGTDGFAFGVSTIFGNSGGLYLLRSSALTGSTVNPVPAVTSLSPSSATAGGAAFTLTVNGTGFVKGSTVNWNGVALATTYVSATQLTAAVPASDIATAGSVPVTVTTLAPGGGTSSALTFSVNASTPVATLSVASLSFGSVAIGATSTSQSVTLTNPGTAPLAITSIAATSGFSETSSCGSSLAAAASCTIAVTFSPAGTGDTTGTLTVTDNAAGSPQTVSLSGTGAEPVTIAPASGGSTSATVSSGGTAIYNLTLNGSSGFSGGVSLSCSGAPSNATCQVSPSSLTLSSGGNAAFKVTVNTGSGSTAMLSGSSTIRLASCGLAALLLLPLFTQRRRSVRGGAFIIAIGYVFLSLSGCGGGSSPTTTNPGSPVTSAGTYTLTITATTGNATVAQSLTLVVQ